MQSHLYQGSNKSTTDKMNDDLIENKMKQVFSNAQKSLIN